MANSADYLEDCDCAGCTRAKRENRPTPPDPRTYTSEARYRRDYEEYRRRYGAPSINHLRSPEEIAGFLGIGSDYYGRSISMAMMASEVMMRVSPIMPAPKQPAYLNKKLLLLK